MTTRRAFKLAGLLVAALALALLAVNHNAFGLGSPSTPVVQGQSFSVASGDPLTQTHIHPADILGLSGQVLIACEHLGLLCYDPASDSYDDISGLSYGLDFRPMDIPSLQFSVAPGSQGAAGSAVSDEAGCASPEPHGDVFESPLDKSNLQDLDGDGAACASNHGYALHIEEGSPSDNLDALERDPCQYVDLNCNGSPEQPILFTLAPSSPSLSYFGFSAADILISGIGYAPMVWASSASLGLSNADQIDALCIRENGNGVYDSGDQVLYSLAPGSPSLAALSLSAAHLLRPGPFKIGFSPQAIGLTLNDDVDALTCAGEIDFFDLFLPLVRK
ncbi:MAG: hypothetical protein JXA78_08770 [Anaerolineales bacterium]|nr:hypothetical protein [Anaerolineales bacterium]